MLICKFIEQEEDQRCSFDLNDPALYLKDDEPLPPTPTNEDAEFIPVQAKKKKDRRDQKVTQRHSYDSQSHDHQRIIANRPPTPPAGDRNHSSTGFHAQLRSTTATGQKPVLNDSMRARRNSANQVAIDTAESKEALAPPVVAQPSPKAPSEPDRSANVRQSYSAVTKKKRPPPHRLGEFIIDDQVMPRPNDGSMIKKGRNTGTDFGILTKNLGLAFKVEFRPRLYYIMQFFVISVFIFCFT